VTSAWPRVLAQATHPTFAAAFPRIGAAAPRACGTVQSLRYPRYGVPDRENLLDSVDRILAGWSGQRPDPDFSSVGVVTRLERVRTHLEVGLPEVFRRYGLTPADFRVIVALRRIGGARPGEWLCPSMPHGDEPKQVKPRIPIPRSNQPAA
jgi:hypothetical protein